MDKLKLNEWVVGKLNAQKMSMRELGRKADLPYSNISTVSRKALAVEPNLNSEPDSPQPPPDTEPYRANYLWDTWLAGQRWTCPNF